MNRLLFLTLLALSGAFTARAQQKITTVPATAPMNIPISNADLGTFPYFKTLPNFYPPNQSDSMTVEQNRTYFFDGKNYVVVDGQVSAQRFSIRDNKKKIPSEFQIIQEYDRMITTLGGKKIYAGKLPEEPLVKITGEGIVDLQAKQQLASSAHYGVVEYLIKTPQKEVWLQVVPASIASGFYSLLVVERQSQLLTTNINKENLILKSLEKSGKATTHFSFGLDSTMLLTESKDELLAIVGVFQAHPDWKLTIDIHNAPVGKPDYALALTQKRVVAVKEELISLGVKPASIEVNGLGDTKPMVPNDTEKGRQMNTRVEISKR